MLLTSHFKTFNRGQDHVSGVALRAKTEGGSKRKTTVIPPWRDFEDWPPRSNEEIAPERRF
jgi:hypothetical protein